MKEYTTEKIRNIAMVSHSGAGKTTLADALLFFKGAINRRGIVQEGTTVSDFDEEEQRRQLSLSTSVVPLEHNDHKINLLDTPGYPRFCRGSDLFAAGMRKHVGGCGCGLRR